jgi:hypothetical protein
LTWLLFSVEGAVFFTYEFISIDKS